jgi:hypothetical protein
LELELWELELRELEPELRELEPWEADEPEEVRVTGVTV